MKWIKRLFVFLLVIITVGLIHYYLPQRDIVQVVNTDVKRMDISKGSPFWDRPDAGTDQQETRDVRFIYTVDKKDKTMVCLLYTSPSPRDKRQSRMPSSA